ncbi:MAG: xanthine dehydrogenase family protein subunit M [Roseiflexaceae bacterium]
MSDQTSLGQAAAAPGEKRAGGTDLQARRNTGVSSGPLVDLQQLPGLDRIEVDALGGVQIGALVSIAALAEHAQILGCYSALSAAAAELGTPQIRAVATVGGNLLQRTRCWYYRHPATSCYKKGGDTCPARAGNHQYGVCFDLGPCVAPHPSTLGLALLAYDGVVELHQGARMSAAALFGDGSDPRADHQLRPGDLLTHITLPPAHPGEVSAYLRLAGRTMADWPLIEVLVRLVVDEHIRFARIAVGGVAPIPLRLHQAEQALVGKVATTALWEQVAQVAVADACPLPKTAYKVPLLRAALADALERALYQPPVPAMEAEEALPVP